MMQMKPEHVADHDWLDESNFDESAVPEWQCISTFERKKLKMKKHRR